MNIKARWIYITLKTVLELQWLLESLTIQINMCQVQVLMIQIFLIKNKILNIGLEHQIEISGKIIKILELELII